MIGAFFDATGDYDAGFYFAGAMMFVSGIMLFLLPMIKQVEHVPKEEGPYSQSSIKFLEAALTIRSAVAWQLGVPPLSYTYKPTLHRQNFDTDVSKF